MNPQAMSILLAVALGIFTLSMIRRLLPLFAMQKEKRWDGVGRRLRNLMVFAFGQRRFFGSFELVHGLAHVLIFWGFLLLSVNTINLIGSGFVPGWSIPGLQGPSLGFAYALAKEIFILAVLVGCGVALVRRLFLRPERLTLSFEADIILLWICAMMALDILHQGALTLSSSHKPGQDTAFFMGRVGGLLLTLMGFQAGSPTTDLLLSIGYWGHTILVLSFLNYLPYGKHFHMLTSLPAVFFQISNLPDLFLRLTWKSRTVSLV